MKKLSFDTVSYARWVLRWRFSILIGGVLVALLGASGARFLWINTNYRALFSEENPQLTAFEALQKTYTKNDNILFVLEPPDGKVFTRENLLVIQAFTREAWEIPYAIRVDGIANFQHIRADGDEIIVDNLVTDATGWSPKEVGKIRQLALAEPALLNRLVSPSGHVTGINVILQLSGEESSEIPRAVTCARKLAETYEARYPGFNIYLTGMVMVTDAFTEAFAQDARTLIPLMYLGMFAVMAWLLGSFSGTITAVLVVTFSSAIAMGLAGWFHVGLTPPSAQAPIMIMTLGIADCIHILVTMLREFRQDKSREEAIVESLRINLQPVFLTSLTTAVGFLSMNFSDSPPFRHLGNITAVGVWAAFIYSVLFLPALMAILPIREKPDHRIDRVTFERLSHFVIHRNRPLLWGFSLIILSLISFIPCNELNDQSVDYFDESIPFRTDSDFTMENLTGIYQIEFSIGAGGSGRICEPGYLSKLEEFAEWYRKQSYVHHVNSFSQVMKRLNKAMHGDGEAWHLIPAERDLAAQYLLLYEMLLPNGLDLNDQIDVDRSATRFTVTLERVPSREIIELTAKGEEWLRDNAPEQMAATGAGLSVVYSQISRRNSESMLTGTILALIVISLSLILALHSFKFGCLSMIPNLIPITMAFGLWGLLVGLVNLGLSIIIGMTIGIVVDDTVHFLSKYLRAQREKNFDPPAAVAYAFSSVGLAMILTSAILIVGFGIISLSSFDLNASMGKFTTITILFALLADFLLLPSLLLRVDREKKWPLGELESEFPNGMDKVARRA